MEKKERQFKKEIETLEFQVRFEIKWTIIYFLL